jgi:hypothetical protein
VTNRTLASWLASVGGWAAAYGFLFAASRDNHPNATLNACATLLFVLFSAGAASLNRNWLWPGLWSRGRRVAYAGALLGTVGLVTLLVVASIRGVYLLLWYDDPRMFGFWTNVGLDFVVVSALVAGSAGLGGVAGRLR